MTPAQHYFTSALVTAVTAFVFAIFVFRNSPNRKLAHHFIWYAFCIAHWSFFVFACTYVSDHELSYQLARICHFIGVFIPVAFLHFSYVLINSKKQWLRRVIIISYFIAGIISASILIKPQLFISDVVPKFTFHFFPNAGPLFYLWTALFVLLVMLTLSVLFLEARMRIGGEKKKLLFFIIANSLGYLGGIGCFLPVYNIELFPFPYGIWGVFFFVCVTFYAVIRYQFIDVEVIVKKTLVFAGIVAAAVSVIAFPFALIQVAIGNVFGAPSPFVILLLGIITTALIFSPLERLLLNLTDKYLFQKKFDYRRILKIASEGLADINSLNHQLRLVVHFLTLRARIKGAAIYMPENGENNFILKASRPEEMTNQIKKLEYDSPILLYLKAEKKKTYLEYQSIEEAATKYAKNAMYSYNLPKLLEDMKRLRAHLIVPSFYQGKLQGLLVLDGKKSDETYNEEDINLFQTIALESAIAFENARKHDELIEQNIKLEQMNDELKRTQAEVIQAKEEAAVSALSGGINHEIKNSIYGLTNNADQVAAALDHIGKSLKLWYRSGDAVPVRQKRELFENLEEALGAIIIVQQASQHIDDVARTLAEISKGKYAKMGRISIRTFLKGIVTIGMLRTYGDRVKTQGFENPPEVDAPRELPSVRGHTELLKAVFINFFKNSIHAMDGIFPKKIEIRAMLDPDDKDMVRVEFSDNGKGIPPDVLPKIFDYGFTTKGSEGEGKGLYNVKAIIEGQHKGKILVQSEVGKGTTFIIKLPIWKDEEELQ
ncbi:MAG TPA: ATP-binding protein [Candidatus Omnitrophota bacterium]|nr:ATP-binding protein [Candidatus Omnitrophota bacterium]